MDLLDCAFLDWTIFFLKERVTWFVSGTIRFFQNSLFQVYHSKHKHKENDE
jgi:hypothetical protein